MAKDKQPQEADRSLNLYQKLLKITEEVGMIEKTGRNSMQNYAFIEQAQVVATLRPQLAKWGVFIIPETISRTVERYDVTRGNGKPGVDMHALVVSRYTVINADKPDERFVCEWDAGEAIDSSDKATNKATTASHKYYLMKLFNISDKEDADAESPEPATPTAQMSRRISIPQVSLLFNMVRQGTGIQEKGDIANWLQSEGVLNKPPTELRTNEFEAAMEKVKKAVREDKVMNSLPTPPTPIPDDIPDNLTLDDVPY